MTEEPRELIVELLEACRSAIRVIAETTPFVDDDDPYLGRIFGPVAQRKDSSRHTLRHVIHRAERWLLVSGKPASAARENPVLPVPRAQEK